MNMHSEVQPTRKESLIEGVLKRGLCRELAAWYIDVSPSTFDKMVEAGLMPKPKKPHGKRKVWDRKLVDRYFDALPGENSEVNDDEDWEAS